VEVVLARRQHAHQRALAELVEADRAAVRRRRHGHGGALRVIDTAVRRRRRAVRERRQHGDVVGVETERLHRPRPRGPCDCRDDSIGVGAVSARQGDRVERAAGEVEEDVEDDGDEDAYARVLRRRGRRGAGHCRGDRDDIERGEIPETQFAERKGSM